MKNLPWSTPTKKNLPRLAELPPLIRQMRQDRDGRRHRLNSSTCWQILLPVSYKNRWGASFPSIVHAHSCAENSSLAHTRSSVDYDQNGVLLVLRWLGRRVEPRNTLLLQRLVLGDRCEECPTTVLLPTIPVSSARPVCHAAGMHACIVAHDIAHTLVSVGKEKRWLMLSMCAAHTRSAEALAMADCAGGEGPSRERRRCSRRSGKKEDENDGVDR